MSEDIGLNIRSTADLGAIDALIAALRNFGGTLGGLSGMTDVAGRAATTAAGGLGTMSQAAQQGVAAAAACAAASGAMGGKIQEVGQKAAAAGQQGAAGFGAIQKSLNTIIAGGALVAIPLGITKMLRAGKQMLEEALNWSTAIGDFSVKLGTTTEDTSRLAVALKIAGGSLAAAGPSFTYLSRQLNSYREAVLAGKTPTGNFATQIADMGIKVLDANQNIRPMVELFPQLMGEINKLPEGAMRAAAQVEVFGRSVEGVGEISEMTEGQIADLMTKADKFGMVMDAETAQAAETLQMKLAELRTVGEGLKVKVVTALIPAFTELVTSFNDTAASASDLGNALGDLFPQQERAAGGAKRFTDYLREQVGLFGPTSWLLKQTGEAFGGLAESIRYMAGAEEERDRGTSAATTTMSGATRVALEYRDAVDGYVTSTHGAEQAQAMLEQRERQGARTRYELIASIRDYDSQIAGAEADLAAARKSAGASVGKYLADLELGRVRSAEEAGKKVAWAFIDANQLIDDNAAELTVEMAAEFRARNEAAKKAADDAAQYDAGLAGEIMEAEKWYQSERIRISKITDEKERATAAAILDREMNDLTGRAKETSEMKRRQAEEDKRARIAEMSEAGVAAAEAFVEALKDKRKELVEVWKTIMADMLNRKPWVDAAKDVDIFTGALETVRKKAQEVADVIRGIKLPGQAGGGVPEGETLLNLRGGGFVPGTGPMLMVAHGGEYFGKSPSILDQHREEYPVNIYANVQGPTDVQALAYAVSQQIARKRRAARWR